ncbi:phenylacetate-CoA oxygenase subunit PaaJ [Bacillus salipaludis]|uniref:1,2-phenylacetyl-CoA epoxidase subunit PaaD n=1 Tax=Bacillus salipaludis TaxID=2547811 RepID=A0A4R5VVY0_9BACI|nr:1,2-phenylacetyl-CoA epoxidase subunit PaaD [Bacillus salipaludis]MDQ6597170.1 1,2-phenylacetyl-CoA epoxidase subunit PaaD [Bacillus salipaludis]TDK63379.1 phenylacetate-CoA oxygenase subunit PaaJ [Bacillus salipaludis]
MQMSIKSLEKQVLDVLNEVKDPEIDTVSIIDLGMVEEVMAENGVIEIKILPTFLGCPALSIIQKNIENAVKAIEYVEKVKVEFINHPPWTSDRISEKGRNGLKAFGIAPPPRLMDSDGSWHVDCPFCGSTYVTMDNIFGPTACRSILYCKNCKNPFEAMKPISTLM